MTETSRGSIAHAGQFFASNASILKGDCTVQPVHLPYTPSSFISMVRKCSISSATVWTPLLSQILQAARHNREHLLTLQGLDLVMALGASLPPNDLKWGSENGLVIVNYFALTETGGLLYTVPEKVDDFAPHLFRPIEGTGVVLLPVEENANTDGVKLLEIIVPSDSPIRPGDAFASPIDGHFHTGDFFEEIFPGRYEYRGRMDDWIKMSNATRCNTKAIKDHIRASCSDLISECVVVGSGRVCPAVLVERRPSFVDDDQSVKREIVSRSKEFNSRRYTNEQIPGEELIFVVRTGDLPRTATKGNVRRKAAEEQYQELLDRAFS